ncbi:alpha/beta fold hydrolase [Streptomyces olivaceus]|uniref:alpha/beta hydrolase family protein n=1 Tax=Streptomyces olivaceus TaxID=47716 RepID=UPI001CCCDCA5|nr:alpha/beta fold hydrolase [Streptomyces olivaceus]MBZ6080495.1 alpha/beta fold hydrolase [Streptomyces olivaceus]
MSTAIPTAHTPGVTPATVSFTPLVIRSPGRPVDLTVRVSAPVTGDALPVVLLSHGHGPSNYVSSLYGYGPLADYYAAHGFVVIQPTHLSSATLGLRESDRQGAPLFWRERALDMHLILDRLDRIEADVPLLKGRMDHGRVAVVGHSMGGHTAGLLLGARLKDPADGSDVGLADPRITAGVMISAPGRGGAALSEHAAEHYPFFGAPDFSTMTTPTLVVAGDDDHVEYLTVVGPSWFTDPYTLSPSPKSLLTVLRGGHGVGGVAGYDLKETTDESPQMVSLVRRVSAAYLRSQLYPGNSAFQKAVDALAAEDSPLGRVESK